MNGRNANWEQFKTILWLRWRLLHNQLAKSGKFNLALTLVLIWSLFVLSALSLFISLGLGVLLLHHAQPIHAMIIWDILIAVFLLMWFIGLMTEMQRSEFLSLEKMLQLPMSLKSAFALNYLTSLCTLSIIFFVPTAVGLSLAFAIVHGPSLLLMLPLIAALIWMVTALTHQFRGWIASMMVNERWRRRIIVGMTLTFIAMTQVPNLVIQYAVHSDDPMAAEQRKERNALEKEANATSANEADRKKRLKEIERRFQAQAQLHRTERAKARENYLGLANTIVPLGWPALCCKQLMTPQFGMSFIAMFALLAVGMLSFSRSYITTLRIYTRDEGRKIRVGGTRPAISTSPLRKSNWLERTVPWLSDHVSTVAIASMVNLIRAPEAKMALIGPFSMLGILVAIMFGKRRTSIPAGVEGFLLYGSIGMILFFMAILSLNAFGMDRSSFRAMIMMPVQRRDILAGKNFAMFPIFLIMAIPTMLIVNMLAPASILCNVSTLLQGASILIMICLIGNLMSIYFPLAMASGTAKPVRMNFKVVGMQMLATFAFPLMMLPGVIALGIELALSEFAGINYLPIYLGLSVTQLFIAQYIYRRQIVRQGSILQARETKIIEALAVHAE